MELPTVPARIDPRSASTALLLAAIFFVAIFPTLRWLEFSNTSEGLNVATALEIRRTGNWLVPTLEGQTRLAKPPLPAWVTAAVIPTDTLEAISSTERDARVHGSATLSTIVRTIPLLCAVGTLLATFAIGKLLFNDDVGLASMIVAGTSLLTMRYCRLGNTDMHLTLWVTVTNALFCFAAIRREWTYGLLGAGVALALAMMSKGPVCLAQTVAPVVVYGLIAPRRNMPPLRPLLIGTLAFIVLGLTWYVLVLIKIPNALHVFSVELRGHPDEDKVRSSVFTYFLLIPYMTPWVIFFAASIVFAIRRWDARDRLLLMFIIVPIVIMSFSPDRYERYLLPMIPACAILTARLIVVHVQKLKWNTLDTILNALHWVVIAGMAVGLPLAGAYAKQLRTTGDKPWWTAALAWQSAAFAAAVLVIAILLQRRKPTALIIATAALMLALQSLFMSGYVKTEQARSNFRPLAELIWSMAPDARLYHTDPKGRRGPIDLSIYLNRSIPLVDSIDAIPPGEGATGLLVPQAKNDPEPVVPTGWMKVANRPRDSKHWWLLLNNATTRPSAGKIPIP